MKVWEMRISIFGQYPDGTYFGADPKWWGECGRNLVRLVARLEKPMPRDWSDELESHVESAQTVALVKVKEDDKVVACWGERV